ncbi:MAG: ATP-binding cassette domain-containing protein [Paludibacteraceae bacterium]|nr:ATP-binding cassette domain-containing protein [Paludibacteraceae bacterium]
MDGTNQLIKYNSVNLQQAEVVVLRDVNLEVHKGEFIYLIGRVGSGKSTLLKSFYAEVPIAGADQARIFEFDLTKIKRGKVPFLRRQLGIVYQDLQLLTDRTVYDNLAFVLRATGWRKDERAKRINEVLQQVGMENKGYKMPHQLSGGEQQRIVIARALLNNPQIILADEPTGHLDPETGREIVQLLHRISENGTTVIMSTHNLSWLELFPGRVLRFDDERMQEVFDSENEDDWEEDELSQIISDVQREENEPSPRQSADASMATAVSAAAASESWQVEENDPERETDSLPETVQSADHDDLNASSEAFVVEESSPAVLNEEPSSVHDEVAPTLSSDEPVDSHTDSPNGQEQASIDDQHDEASSDNETVGDVNVDDEETEEEEEIIITVEEETEESSEEPEPAEDVAHQTVSAQEESGVDENETADEAVSVNDAVPETNTESVPDARVNNDRWSLRDEQMRRIREAHEKMAREALAHDAREKEERRKADEVLRKAEEEHERLLREEQNRNRAEQEREERIKAERELRLAEEHERIVKAEQARMEREERENIEANKQLKAKTNSIADESLRWTDEDASYPSSVSQLNKKEEEQQRETARQQAELAAREEAHQKEIAEAKDEVMRELERQLAEAHKNKKRIEIPKRNED